MLFVAVAVTEAANLPWQGSVTTCFWLVNSLLAVAASSCKGCPVPYTMPQTSMQCVALLSSHLTLLSACCCSYYKNTITKLPCFLHIVVPIMYKITKLPCFLHVSKLVQTLMDAPPDVTLGAATP